jgi:hypothetical protein
VFLPLFCGRSHHVSPLVFRDFFLSALKALSPRRLSGERPQLGDGVPKLALGGPPGGSPGPTRHRHPVLVTKNHEKGPGGVLGGPLGGPRGGLCGAQGASGGVRGTLPGGYPPGGGPRGPHPPHNHKNPQPTPPPTPPGPFFLRLATHTGAR